MDELGSSALKDGTARGILLRSMLTDHVVQLFDGEDSLIAGASGFLLDGLARRETVLAVTGGHRWAGITQQMTEAGTDVSYPSVASRVTWIDATSLAGQIAPDGRVRTDVFDRTVGGTVRRLARPGRTLCIYGDLVDVLAQRGDFTAAHKVEELWNVLAAQHRFRLFCGYDAAHFGDPRTRGALAAICRQHRRVDAHPSDALATWLVSCCG